MGGKEVNADFSRWKFIRKSFMQFSLVSSYAMRFFFKSRTLMTKKRASKYRNITEVKLEDQIWNWVFIAQITDAK